MSLSMFLNNMENDIVLESAFKEKIDSIIDKIKKFISKVINWIKTKVYGFLKIDSVKMDSEEYNDCIKLLQQFKLNPEFGIGVLTLKESNKSNADKYDGKLEDFHTLITKIKGSVEYKNFINKEYKKSHMIVVQTSKISSSIHMLERDMELFTKFTDSLRVETKKYDYKGKEEIFTSSSNPKEEDRFIHGKSIEFVNAIIQYLSLKISISLRCSP